jgi:hypothetical protein
MSAERRRSEVVRPVPGEALSWKHWDRIFEEVSTLFQSEEALKNALVGTGNGPQIIKLMREIERGSKEPSNTALEILVPFGGDRDGAIRLSKVWPQDQLTSKLSYLATLVLTPASLRLGWLDVEFPLVPERGCLRLSWKRRGRRGHDVALVRCLWSGAFMADYMRGLSEHAAAQEWELHDVRISLEDDQVNELRSAKHEDREDVLRSIYSGAIAQAKLFRPRVLLFSLAAEIPNDVILAPKEEDMQLRIVTSGGDQSLEGQVVQIRQNDTKIGTLLGKQLKAGVGNPERFLCLRVGKAPSPGGPESHRWSGFFACFPNGASRVENLYIEGWPVRQGIELSNETRRQLRKKLLESDRFSAIISMYCDVTIAAAGLVKELTDEKRLAHHIEIYTADLTSDLLEHMCWYPQFIKAACGVDSYHYGRLTMQAAIDGRSRKVEPLVVLSETVQKQGFTCTADLCRRFRKPLSLSDLFDAESQRDGRGKRTTQARASKTEDGSGISEE